MDTAIPSAYGDHSATRPRHCKRSFELQSDEPDQASISGVTTRAMHKRLRRLEPVNPFDRLCDDLILLILASLSSRARAPSHLIAAALTCKRFRTLTMQKRVLAQASNHALAVRPSAWCKGADSFLRLCVDSGSLEACFTLGMVMMNPYIRYLCIEFYCMGKRREGVELVAKAAKACHRDALYAVAIIHLNGSGGKASDKNTNAGVALCVRAALRGSVEALRELGHSFKEGQGGLPRNAIVGRQLLLEANRKEAALFVSTVSKSREGIRSMVKPRARQCPRQAHRLALYKELLRRSLLSDYGCAFPLRWVQRNAHPVHLFMVEWFATHAPLGRGFLRVCSYALCGRSETRPLEFRQCSICSAAFYCSRSCQSMDWKLRHMVVCHPSVPCLL